MFTYLNDESFRRSLFENLSNHAGKWSYYPPEIFPPLHRYTKLSKYAVDDITNQKTTATSIREFNDVYDGVIHNQQKCVSEIEDTWNVIETIHKTNGIELSKDRHREYIDRQKSNIRLMNPSSFTFLKRLGFYICCFSADDRSTLMWAHYADSNSGLCVSYDFNRLKQDDLFRSIILPVAYLNEPIIMPRLSEYSSTTANSIEIDVLSVALAKATTWEYEKEWRLIFTVPPIDNQIKKRVSLKMPILPYKITLGYLFLKKLCVYDNCKDEDKKEASDNISSLSSLLDYSRKNNISVAIMVPILGTYGFTTRQISASLLLGLIHQHFKNGKPINMRYFNVIQCNLMELLDKENPNA